MNKVERNIDKNYYSDSIMAVRHSEYTVNNSTKEFEKVVCIEYFPTPMWSLDENFYNQKFGFDNSIFSIRIIGYLIMAKLYKKDESVNLGFTFPYRFASSYLRIDIDDFNSSLAYFVGNNRKKREDLKSNSEINLQNNNNMQSFNVNDDFRNQKPQITIEYGNNNNGKKSNTTSTSTNNLPKKISITTNPIYTKISDSVVYIVDDLVYDSIDCYRLTKIIKTKFIYTESDRQRFENETLKLEYPNLSESKKNELRQLVEYWANGESVFSQTYIVDKKNFAVLSFLREIKKQNYKGEWIDIEKITEKYRKGKNKKYYQYFYTKLIRNYNGGFSNIDNFLTLVIRTPMENSFSLDSTTIIPRKPYLTYEDFCEKVDSLDDEMMFDWNNYER